MSWEETKMTENINEYPDDNHLNEMDNDEKLRHVQATMKIFELEQHRELAQDKLNSGDVQWDDPEYGQLQDEILGIEHDIKEIKQSINQHE